MQKAEWPSLPYTDWAETCETIHAWTQIIGKVKMALSVPENHWWHVALQVTPRGISSGTIPFESRTFQIDLDLVSHELRIITSDAKIEIVKLEAKTVKVFYAEFLEAMARAGISMKIDTLPKEVKDPIRFDEDTVHASYDRKSVEKFRNILVSCDRTLREFRAKFCGQTSPVHFFWGSFDLALSRFSGKTAPQKSEGGKTTQVSQDFSVGFWPGSPSYPKPAFYAYALPPPEAYYDSIISPKQARFDAKLGEFILDYDDLILLDDPKQAILEFAESTYVAAADLGNWDRDQLECLVLEHIPG